MVLGRIQDDERDHEGQAGLDGLDGLDEPDGLGGLGGLGNGPAVSRLLTRPLYKQFYNLVTACCPVRAVRIAGFKPCGRGGWDARTAGSRRHVVEGQPTGVVLAGRR